MNNGEVAALLYELADLLEVQGVEFKPRAYRKAAQTIESLADDVAVIYKEKGAKGLMEIPGVGEGIAEKIVQYLTTGKIRQIGELKKKLPLEPALLELGGLGPKTVQRLYQELKIKTLKQLEEAAKRGKIAELKGFGERSQQEILDALERKKQSKQRMLLGEALPLGRAICTYLQQHCKLEHIDLAGSLRRRKETIGDIDILICTKQAQQATQALVRYPEVANVLLQGETKTTVLLKDGIQVDVRVIPPLSYGAALLYFTGSKNFNIALRKMAIEKRWKLNEYGLYAGTKMLGGKEEQDLFDRFKMQYIEPEMREDVGEIALSLKHQLPKIVELKDIRGDLQLQTRWSDGTSTIEEYARLAEQQGYEYIAITDHTNTLKIAHGLTPSQLEKQWQEIDKLGKKHKDIRIFKGAEVNILSDGSFDLPQSVIDKLDFVLASIHSGFRQSRQQIMKRLVSAMEHGANAIAHPTGRKIYQREPYEVDWDMLFDKAKATDTALEINASPERSDLSDVYACSAGKRGCLLTINTDAHNTDHMRFMELGVSIARRAWLQPKSIINTWPVKKIEKWMKKK